jgi:hypothetical protein
LDAIRSQLEKRWFVAEGGVKSKLTDVGGKSASRGGGSPGSAFTVQRYGDGDGDGAIQSNAPGGKSYKKEAPYAWDRSTYSGRASESHAESKSDFTPMRMMQSSTRRPATSNRLFSRDIPIVSARDLSLLKTKGTNLNIDELM